MSAFGIGARVKITNPSRQDKGIEYTVAELRPDGKYRLRYQGPAGDYETVATESSLTRVIQIPTLADIERAMR